MPINVCLPPLDSNPEWASSLCSQKGSRKRCCNSDISSKPTLPLTSQRLAPWLGGALPGPPFPGWGLEFTLSVHVRSVLSSWYSTYRISPATSVSHQNHTATDQKLLTPCSKCQPGESWDWGWTTIPTCSTRLSIILNPTQEPDPQVTFSMMHVYTDHWVSLN
jgi:hypothetical protein